MDIEDVLRRMAADVHARLEERDRLAAELRQAEVDLETLGRELEVLETAARKYAEGAAGRSERPEASLSWRSLNRQSATARAMAEMERPVRIPEIAEYLKSVGRFDDTAHLVSAALAALKRKGVVESHQRGVWQLAGTHDVPAGLMPMLGIEVDADAEGGEL